MGRVEVDTFDKRLCTFCVQVLPSRAVHQFDKGEESDKGNRASVFAIRYDKRSSQPLRIIPSKTPAGLARPYHMIRNVQSSQTRV